MLIHDTSQRFGLFEHASMCNQKGGVKIQNRGPEQEIPAVTCVRLIAQKHRYQRHGSCANPLILENELKLMFSLISCRSGTFRRRELRSIKNYELCLKYWNAKSDKKTARKREILGGLRAKNSSSFAIFVCSPHSQWREWGIFQLRNPSPILVLSPSSR